MSEKNKLILQMGIFFILVVATFTYIVINEKKYVILTPKIEKRLNEYIDKNYKEEKNNLNISKLKYIKDEDKYQIKLTNKENKNLYFYITYKKKKITNTYKKDYLEGKSLYDNFEQEYIKNMELENAKLSFSKKLNNYPKTIYKKILTEDLKKLSLYSVSSELVVDNSKQKTIIETINNFYQKNKSLGYSPKEYELIIINKNDINFSIKISKLTDNLITNNLTEIVSGIIKNDNSIMNKYSITYKYLN